MDYYYKYLKYKNKYNNLKNQIGGIPKRINTDITDLPKKYNIIKIIINKNLYLSIWKSKIINEIIYEFIILVINL